MGEGNFWELVALSGICSCKLAKPVPACLLEETSSACGSQRRRGKDLLFGLKGSLQGIASLHDLFKA